MDYRIEDKYLITDDQIACLKVRLREIMNYDPNITGDSYLIRSVYFDDRNNSCIKEIEGGYNHREKYRIRTYNNDDSLIKLELKSKVNGRTHKDSVKISRLETQEIITKGCIQSIRQETPPIIKKLWVEGRLMDMKPINIVEYERCAFVEPKGNVRITFDRNIGYSKNPQIFFDRNIDAIPIMPVGLHVMEIKYDEILPKYIKEIVDTGRLQRISYSKYYYSRKGVL